MERDMTHKGKQEADTWAWSQILKCGCERCEKLLAERREILEKEENGQA